MADWQPGDPVYEVPSISALAEALDVPAEVLEMDTHNHWSYYQDALTAETWVSRSCFLTSADAARWQPDQAIDEDPRLTGAGILVLPDKFSFPDQQPPDGYDEPDWAAVFAEGCRCYIREDVDYGDVLTRPPGGCPIHSCTCLAEARTGKHSITCRTVALSQPNAMVCPDGDVFYADNPEDVAGFARDHDAKPLNPEAFYAMFPELVGAGHG